MRGRRWNLALFVVAAIPFLLLELALRKFPADRLVSKALYYQQMDTPVYQVSADPFLHYELRPGAELSGKEPRPYTIRINRWGARGQEHPQRKAPGTFRILAFGGSTMFGFAVDDEQTIAAELERLLNAESDGQHYEVWNFGASAYAASQVARLVRREGDRHDPDLILFQLHNEGRRPFLLPNDAALVPFTPLLGDEDTVLENFPPPMLLPAAAHLGLMRSSSAYRAVTAFLKIAGAPSFGMDSSSAYGDRISFREVSHLVAWLRARPVRFQFFTLPQARTPPERIGEGVAESDVIRLYQSAREAEFYDEHPPPYILAEWAGIIAGELRRRHLLTPRPPTRVLGGRDLSRMREVLQASCSATKGSGDAQKRGTPPASSAVTFAPRL